MIEAYRAGVPGKGKPLPEGFMIAKIEWKLKKSAESPLSRECYGHPGSRWFHGEGQQEIHAHGQRLMEICSV
jgi:hypothetical protein